ncbi:MAG: acetolactate decarboxylase [Simkania sp.]|nr:acetolactate decarboxylase [Simkania sp.]MCP5490308.1 acetolactate decarboxylase [Chlamydiales bacterium]
MKYFWFFLLPLFSLFSKESQIFQVSTFSALMEGVYDGSMTYEEVAKQGDFGLGTFNQINGEMVALDGVFYQDSPNGTLSKVQPSETTPFAVVTFFKSSFSQKLLSSKNFGHLGKLLFPSIVQKNTPHALKIEGSFRHLHLRSLPKQEPPYSDLVQAVKKQNEYDFYDIEGTLVGYYFPEYLNGVNVGGFHFHFISSDHTKGGHVLEVSTKSGTCYFQPCENLKIHFPNSSSFAEANLSEDLEEIHDVEQPELKGY